jgi:hypothetical protein
MPDLARQAARFAEDIQQLVNGNGLRWDNEGLQLSRAVRTMLPYGGLG